jgi:hypothetical protein
VKWLVLHPPRASKCLVGGGGQQPGGQQPGSGQQPGGDQQPGPTPPAQPAPGPTVYKRYRVQLTNKSITGADAREQAWQLLQELRKVVDAANQDLTQVTAEGRQGAIEAKAEALGAQSWWRTTTSDRTVRRDSGPLFR